MDTDVFDLQEIKRVAVFLCFDISFIFLFLVADIVICQHYQWQSLEIDPSKRFL